MSEKKINVNVTYGAMSHDQTLSAPRYDSYKLLYLPDMEYIEIIITVQGHWYFAGINILLTGIEIWAI